MAQRAPVSPKPSKTANIARVTEEMYRRNLELAETNKTLLLLRKIDEIVLSSVTDTDMVMQQMARTLAEESGFPYAAIYLRNQRKGTLEPKSVVVRIGDRQAQSVCREQVMQHDLSMRYTHNPAVRSVKNLVIVPSSELFETLQPYVPIDEAESLQEKLALKSFFACPLLARNDVLGTLIVGTPETNEQLSYYEKSLLERLTVSVGVALDNTLLYAETQESSKRLRTANRHLKELDKAKDEFISLASHQLRTPLTSIKGYISMLLEGDAGPVTKEQQEFLSYAFSGSQRMVNLISDLLNISRMSAGKFMIDQTEVDLQKMVAEETQQLQQHASVKGLKLVFVAPKKPVPAIKLDENKTRQVVMNFIDNAIYYTKSGSVTVTLRQEKQELILEVTDTGIGVPPDAQKKLFTKFFRADNAQTVRPDGTGLGLFLAKRVIEDQGGTIIFRSVPGGGSTFGFSMPLTKESHDTHQ